MHFHAVSSAVFGCFSTNSRLVAIAFAILLTFCASDNLAADEDAQTIDLAGDWSCRLDPEKEGVQQKWFGQEFETTVKLPGSLDENGLGSKVLVKPELTNDILQRLSRKVSYIGPAWYQRQISIPEQWNRKRIPPHA